MPDEARYGILWMGRRALATAFDMEGGVQRRRAETDARRVGGRGDRPQLDRLLEPYGGLGATPAFAPGLQLVPQQRAPADCAGSACSLPLSSSCRWRPSCSTSCCGGSITVQREQIAALKAHGLFELRAVGVALHGKLEPVDQPSFGAHPRTCWLGGNWLGRGMIGMYNELLQASRSWTTGMTAVPGRPRRSVGFSVWRRRSSERSIAVRRSRCSLPPAEAMRPGAAGQLPHDVGRTRWG